MIKNYRDLRVWKAGIDLSVSVYKATEAFPKSEMFGLVSQMRRAACSVPANVAEGFSRQYKTEFVQFLHIAKGSASELDTFVCLSERLGYLQADGAASLAQQVDAIGKMLYGLISTLRKENA